MLTNNKNLKGLVLRATDGEIGTLDQLYFDDQIWAIRYLTVDTGSWLNGRHVLISPHSILQTDWKAGRIDVSLTRKQVENAPDIDTHRPVSRQHEAQYYGYYGYPYYWEGPYMWGPSYSPIGMLPMTASESTIAERIRKESSDSHLRTTQAVAGYYIDAKDGEIGHVERYRATYRCHPARHRAGTGRETHSVRRLTRAHGQHQFFTIRNSGTPAKEH